MKVLMLGWEFPPHISGGLGTACFGLTQGLRKHETDVTFVIPRTHGDEDSRFVRIVGCNEVPVSAEGREVGSISEGGVLPGGVKFTEDSAVVENARRSLRVITVDSLLSPYTDPTLYEQRYAEWLAAQDGASSARDLDAFWQSVIGLPGLGEFGQKLDAVIRGDRNLEFSGAYGPDLMAEVARYALCVAEIARNRDFDVVHAHDWMTYPAGMLAAAVTNKPLVVHMHASEYDRSGENVNRQIQELEHLGLHGSDLVICVSHYTAGIMRDRYGVDPNKLRVVHNAVMQKEERQVGPWKKAIDEPIVLFLGRVTFQKGPDYFLEAAAKVVKLLPKVKFVMAGSGDMLPSMVERAARLGLARNIHFTGFLRGKDVERMYAMADLYVMPSVSEPFGISPLEAMALDVPVIVSRQSGVSEVLKHALKVDFWDVDDLANKILAMLRYRPLREELTEEGRREVRGIRWEYPAKLVRDIYAEVA